MDSGIIASGFRHLHRNAIHMLLVRSVSELEEKKRRELRAMSSWRGDSVRFGEDEIDQAAARKKSSSGGIFFRAKTAMSNPGEFCSFVHMLAKLCEQGKSIEQSFMLMAEEQEGTFADILVQCANGIHAGNAPSDVLRASEWFPEDFIGIVSAGEKSASLPDSLRQYSKALRVVTTMDKKLARSVRQPLFMISMSFLFIFIFPYIFGPTIEKMLIDADKDIASVNLVARIMIDFSSILHAIPMVLFVLLMVGVFLFMNIGPGYKFSVAMLKKLPTARKVFNDLQWGQFLMFASICLNIGMTLDRALTITKSIVIPDQVGTDENMIDIIDSVSNRGESLAQALKRYVHKGMMIALLSAAEQSANLKDIMKEQSEQRMEFLDLEIDTMSATLNSYAIAAAVLLGGGTAAACFLGGMGAIYSV